MPRRRNSKMSLAVRGHLLAHRTISHGSSTLRFDGVNMINTNTGRKI